VRSIVEWAGALAEECRVRVAEVPLEIRAEVAWHLIDIGAADPYDALHAALWPEKEVPDETTVEVPSGFCQRGHLLDEANTYIRPGGRRQCRKCRTFHQRGRYRKKARTEPCIHCGAPATPPGYKLKGGLPYARCRACFMKARKEKGRR